MDGEGDGAFERLEFYCSLGPGRSLGEVATRYGVSVRTVGNASSAWRWAERASAWDDSQAEARARVHISEAEELAREHSRRWKIIGDKALEAFESIQSSELSPRDALAMADRATHYQRLGIGEATERTETREHLDTSRLSEEQLVQLHRLLAICRGDG